MNIGVVFPQVEIGQDPAAIRDYAQAVEAMGYTHILAFDHVLGANPERPGGWKGPYTYRHVFHEPFVLFGFLAAVTQRVEEQIVVMRALWTKELVTFEGQWHRVTDAGINPLPHRRPIPIWMGGESEVVLHRAARMADGWMPHFRPSADAQAIVDRLHGDIKAAGRGPSRV